MIQYDVMIFLYLLVGLVRLVVWIAVTTTVAVMWTFGLMMALLSRLFGFRKQRDPRCNCWQDMNLHACQNCHPAAFLKHSR